MPYNKTLWRDYETTISAQKLNKIEDAIEELFNSIESVSDQFNNFSEDENGTLLYKGEHITPPNVVIKSKEETIEHKPEAEFKDILAYSYQKGLWREDGGWSSGCTFTREHLQGSFGTPPGEPPRDTDVFPFNTTSYISKTSGYIGSPYIRINFNNTNILQCTNSNRYIRHLYIGAYYNNNWYILYNSMSSKTLEDGTRINLTTVSGLGTASLATLLKSEYNIHNLKPSDYSNTNIPMTRDFIDCLIREYSDKMNPTFPFDTYTLDEVYIQCTFAADTTNYDTDKPKWVETNANYWKFNVQLPQESTFEYRYQIDNLRVSDEASEKFDSVYLNNIIASLGQFKEGLNPKDFTEHNDNVTTYLANAEEDPSVWLASYEGKYLNSGNIPSFDPVIYPNPSTYAGYCISKPMQIDLVKYSYQFSYFRHFALYAEDGKCLYYTNTAKANGTLDKQFCIDNSIDPAKVKYVAGSNTGTYRTSFKLYYKHINHYYTYELPYLKLTQDQLPDILNTSESHNISLYDVDRIVAIGDSYTESHYTIKDKSWMSKLSQLLDYNMDNFAISGDTYRGQLNKIRTGNYSYASTSHMTWEDLHPTHAILISKTNDTKYMDAQQFIYDMLSCIDTIHGMGCIPIIASEYHVSNQDYVQNAFNNYAEKYGGYCVDLTEETYITRGVKDYAPFWGGSHPGTRPNHLFTDKFYKELTKVLPRPYASIKVYRPRELIYSSGTTLNLDNYLYVTSEERAKLFKEISICHSALKDSKYYDSIVTSSGGFQSQGKIESEYFKLMKNKAVDFNKMCLIDAILPTTVNDVTEVTLNLTCSDSKIQLYVKDIMAEPYPSPEFCRRFDVPQVLTDAQVKVGNTYTSSSTGSTVYTVVEILHDQVESSSGFVDGTIILCSGNKVTTAYSESILTLQSGTGTSTLNTVYDAVGFSSNYPSGKQNVGHYVALTGNKVTGQLLRRAMAVDNIKFLVVSTSDNFIISNISIDFVGPITKSRDTQMYKHTCEYLQLLNSWEPLMTSTKWTTNDVATTTTLADKVFPLCPSTKVAVSTILSFNSADSYIRQYLPQIPYTSFKNVRIKVVALARYFPPIFNPANSVYPNDSMITDTSFDYVELKLYLGIAAKDNVVVSKLVGLHWTMVEFDTIIPARFADNSYNYLKFACESKYLQLASVDVFILNK